MTGANAGLGFATARAILAQDQRWHVVLACRDAERGRQASERLGDAGGTTRVSMIALDLADLASVRDFPDRLREKNLPPLRSVVGNAGIHTTNLATKTKDGFSLVFGTNVLGHYLLVRLLQPQIEEPGRVVLVSSDLHNPAIRSGRSSARYRSPRELAYPDKYPDRDESGLSPIQIAQRRYATSKLCLVLFAYDLARRFQVAGRQISANAFNPGFMPGTGLARDESLMMRFVWFTLFPALAPVLRPIGLPITTPEKSGIALGRLAVDDAFAGITSRYFDRLHDVPSSDASYDQNLAADFWPGCAELVGASPDAN